MMPKIVVFMESELAIYLKISKLPRSYTCYASVWIRGKPLGTLPGLGFHAGWVKKWLRPQPGYLGDYHAENEIQFRRC